MNLNINQEIQKRKSKEEIKRLLLNSMYRTRDAAMNWTKQYTEHLRGLGFTRGRACACNFVHDARNMRLTCHGDDFVISGGDAAQGWITREFERTILLKVMGRLGGGQPKLDGRVAEGVQLGVEAAQLRPT